MILILVITNTAVAAAKCPATKLENLSDEPWNTADVAVYNQVRDINLCPTRFKNSPCIASFIKKEPRLYHVSCGPAIKQK